MDNCINCEICKEDKEICFFESYKTRHGKINVRKQCKECRKNNRKNYNVDWEDPEKIVKCTTCEENLPLTRDNFKKANSSLGYKKSCTRCSNGKKDRGVNYENVLEETETEEKKMEDYNKKKIFEIEKNFEFQKLNKPINLKNGDVIISNCKISTKTQSSSGYPRIYYKSKEMSTHRVYYCLKNNKNPIKFDTNKHVRHLCNNKLCFNMEHLAVGIKENNYDDKKQSGTLPVGEKAYNAKSSDEFILKVKKTKFPKDHPEYLTQEERAKRFGITVYDIRALDSETSWAHLKTENSKTDEELKEIRENLVVRKEKNRYKNWTQEMFEDAKEVFLKHENLLKREDGCFDWTGQSNTFAIFGVQFYIKPIACSLKYKTHKPKDFYTKNICDYNGCCNPEHLIFVKNGREITEEEFQDSVKNGNIPENVEKVIVKTHRKGLKLSIEKAEDIRIQVHLKGASIKEMCEKYDVHNTVINDIVKNKKWKIDEQEFLEKYLNCSVYVGKKITREIAEEIRKLYSLGNTTYQKLADLYDCSVANIQKIIKFETFK